MDSLEQIREYIERVTDEKLLEMRITRRDMEKILARVEDLIGKTKSMLTQLMTIQNTDNKIIGFVKEFAGKTYESHGKIIAGLKILNIGITELKEKTSTGFSKVEEKQKEIIGDIKNLSNTIVLVKETQEMDLNTVRRIDGKIDSIIEKLGEIERKQSELGNTILSASKDISQRVLDITRETVSIRDAIGGLKSQVDFTKRLSENTMRNIGGLVERIDRLQTSINELSNEIRSLNEAIIGVRENQQRLMNTLSEILDMLRLLGRIPQLLEEIRQQIQPATTTTSGEEKQDIHTNT